MMTMPMPNGTNDDGDGDCDHNDNEDSNDDDVGKFGGRCDIDHVMALTSWSGVSSLFRGNMVDIAADEE